jgi:signal transduction histidine kinase
MSSRIVINLSSFFSSLLNAGVEGVSTERLSKKVRLINSLSFTIFLLTVSIGGIFYALTLRQSILIPATVESILSVMPIFFNHHRKYLSAALTTFLLQCVATLYFGMLLGPVLELQTVIFYLLIISFFLFNEPRSRRICCIVALLILTTLEANSYINIIEPLHLKTPYSIIFKTLSFLGLFCLIIVGGYPYVISHDANFDLKTSLENEESQSKDKTLFIARMSHEVQYPFLGIIKQLNALIAILPKGTEQYKLAANLLENCQAVKQMVANALEYTKIDAGVHEKLKKEPTNIREVFEKILSYNTRIAVVEGISLDLFISDELPEYLLSDELRITQAMNNLISNAIKFTESNSTVYIKVTRSNPTWSMKIQDSGKGIPPERIDTIFAPYVTDRESKNNREGIGLGLYITKYIVENLLNGAISAYNSPPLGATFEISLPLIYVPDPALSQNSLS